MSLLSGVECHARRALHGVTQTKTCGNFFCDLRVLGRSTFLTEKQINPACHIVQVVSHSSQVSRAQLTSDDCVAV